MGTTEAEMSFVSGQGDCGGKTIVWKIENFSQFLKMQNEDLEENGIIFEAGYCTLNDGSRIPAQWKYYFKHTQFTQGLFCEDWVGGYLKLNLAASASIDNSKAWCSVSLSSGGQPIPSSTPKRIEFDGTSGWGCHRLLISESKLLEYTTGDALEVTLKVFSTRSFKPFQKTPSQTSTKHLRGKMTSDLIKLLDSGDGADVEIKVPSEVGEEVDDSSYTTMAHKGILMTRSSVFDKMFAKDSTMLEAQTGKVVIKDVSPKGLDIFLHYLYTGEVLQHWVHFLPEVLNAAEKYDCEELKEYCGLNILEAVSATNPVELYKLAKFHGMLEAAKRVADFISMNTEAFLDQC